MTDINCLTDQDLTLTYYSEKPDSCSLPAARRHLTRCAACQQRYQQLSTMLQSLPVFSPELDPHHATRLAARVLDHTPRRRRALPAIAGGLVTALLVFSISIWQPMLPRRDNATEQPVKTTDETPLPDDEILENLDLLKEMEALSELVGV